MLTEMTPGWVQNLLAYIREHPEVAAAICFALGFGESIVLVSFFVPSTVIFLGLGAAHSAAGGSFWPIWLAGAAGAFVGDILSYTVGRHYRHDVDKMWPFTKYPGFIPQGRALVERWGSMSIIGGKFVGGLRPLIPVVAGIMDMPWLVFMLASAASCLIWAGAFLAPGYGLMLAL